MAVVFGLKAARVGLSAYVFGACWRLRFPLQQHVHLLLHLRDLLLQLLHFFATWQRWCTRTGSWRQCVRLRHFNRQHFQRSRWFCREAHFLLRLI